MNALEIAQHFTRPGDPGRLLELMAPDGVIEWPYRPEGVPGVLRGRDEIAAFVGEQGGIITFHEYTDVVFHETADPEVVIVEYTAHGTVTATGAPFTQRPIQVIRVRDGRIVSFRDYVNPLPLLEVIGKR
ncbi:nuclear transport factor 2 family protein [Nonomuraea sediminis]|uniref:nuclear transport factor 2 family protein n=1 Tax=Nonomuraea sediminis TaxID=2835864 RepID=UPI001BDBB1BC|nr:nuclear transport factor 2 family protein [Nonomuraea sediminis]